MTVAAIVLAGGRSSRFGRDKLAVDVDGRPLLWHAIEAVQSVVDEVIVAVGPDDGHGLDLPSGVRLARDAQAFDGPLTGVATGLAATDAGLALVVGGDMPTLVPAVLQRLIDALADPRVDAALLGTHDADDPGRPLPLAVRSEPARRAASALLVTGERRLRALPQALGAVHILEADWRSADPAGATLRDVDVPADLER